MTLVTDKKQRKTQQRKIIQEELTKSHDHPTAQELYKLVQKRASNIGLATVYRTLDYLVKNNKAIRLKSKEKETRYDGCTAKHCHVICKACCHVFDLTDVEKITIKSKQLNKMGFKLDPTYIELFGHCKNCK